MTIDQVFYWCGAVITTSVAVIFTSCLALLAGWLVKKACNYWWDRALTIYRLESLRYYFQIMVENGRTGLLKEVRKSEQEAIAAAAQAQPSKESGHE
jgi:hypothetical protein